MEQNVFKMTPDATILPGMKTVMADKAQPNSVNYIRDVVYANRDGRELKLQLLLPNGEFPKMPDLPFPDRGGKHPLLIYVQGSAWRKQNVYGSLMNLTDFARAGFVVASVEYRGTDEAGWPAFLQDVKSAIRFLRANAETYRIDPAQCAVHGNSSGGHAALMIGLTGDMEEYKTDDNREYSDAVMAVADFYGPTDVTKINDAPRNPIFTADKTQIPEDLLYGGCVVDHPEISQVGNPLNYISPDRDIPPILVAHGDADEMVPFNQSVILVKKLQECRKTVEFYKVVGAGHGIGFDLKKMNQIVIDFLKAYMTL
ncbi:MAG: alpha/beta hydrolase [Lachnospiraceae bacterium]|nr:alpha/beta hydrolase [Lachnospiraceae bacterium]